MPYTTSGDAWLPYTANGVNYNLNPQLVTISFVPDGTNLGSSTSNLFSTFNAKFGSAATWQNVILKAAQVWAQQTNLNFAVVSDSGAAEGSGSYQQGDPTMGDIRIGGYNYGSGNSTLAEAYMPPRVNNYSVAGDIQFNTGQTFNINGQNYDLFAVAAHEFGHALGLYHSNSYGAVMYGTYTGAKAGLAADDTNGIRNIYSNNNPRSPDAFGSLNNSFSAAANINSYIDQNSLTALVNTMDITTAGEKDYYTATAPAGTGGTVTISVQSQGLSLLAPTLTVYAADQVTVLGSASGSGHYGTTLTLNLAGKIAANAAFYVKVGGADSTALGTGAYALTMSFAGNPLPTVPLPNTQVANGNPLSGGGGEALTKPDDDVHGDSFPATETGKDTAGASTPRVVGFVQAASTPAFVPAVTVTIGPGAGSLPAGGYVAEITAPVAQALPARHLHLQAVNPAQDLTDVDSSASDRGTALPAATPATRTETPEPEAARDQSHRDACFADDSWLCATDSGAAAPAGTDGAELALNPAARVAALALVLGGGWAVRTERADRNTRTEAQLPPRPRSR